MIVNEISKKPTSVFLISVMQLKNIPPGSKNKSPVGKYNNIIMKKNLRLTIFLLAAILFLFGGAAYCRIRFPIKYKSEIKYFSDKYDIEENLVFAVIKAESGFNPNKVSEKGAAGLMQIMPETAGYIGERFFSGRKFDLFLPADNIEAGCFYIFYLSEKFENTTEILAAYNAGEGNVKLWKNEKDAPLTENDIPFPETKRYIKRVISYRKIYTVINR